MRYKHLCLCRCLYQSPKTSCLKMVGAHYPFPVLGSFGRKPRQTNQNKTKLITTQLQCYWKHAAGSITQLISHLSHKILLFHLSPSFLLILYAVLGDSCDVGNTHKNLTWSDKNTQTLPQILQKCIKMKLATVKVKFVLQRQVFTLI